MEVIGLYENSETASVASAHSSGVFESSPAFYIPQTSRRSNVRIGNSIPGLQTHPPSLRKGGIWPTGNSPVKYGSSENSNRTQHPSFKVGAFGVRTSQNVNDARDRYGFRKQNQYITLQQYDEWYAKYEKHLARRRKKWELLIRDAGIAFGPEGVPTAFPAKSKKVKRYIRKGIPADWRGAAWFFYAKGGDYLRDNPGLYDRLWQQGMAEPTPDAELIERDLHRTFPDNIYFRNPDAQLSAPGTPGTPGTPGSTTTPGSSGSGTSRRNSTVPDTPIVQALRRVLIAFSLYVPKIGYCQSLNFLTGLLLLFLDEEKTFWMLVIITQKYLPGMHDINLEGANVDQGVLMMCVKESLPSVWNKIGAGLDGYHHDDMILKLPPVTLCTAAWFMSGFIGVLPIESVVRVWDCFFYEGPKVFFRIALTILKLGEPQFNSVRDPMEIFQVVQTIPRQLLDTNALLQACFRRLNGFGHITQEEINERRKFVAERRKYSSDNLEPMDAKGRNARMPSHVLNNLRSSSKYHHYDSITGTYHSKTSNFGRRMQMLRLGSTNMLSLTARNDYFGTAHDDSDSSEQYQAGEK
ncbi:hypothetical protein V1511DRAFT_519979 [Dipodascopsis uninucleata]